MALISPGIPEYDYIPDAPPTIVGDIGQTGLAVTIEVYKDGQLVDIADNSTIEIGDTGSYAWSTSNLPVLGNVREQFYYRFVGPDVEDDGQFILKTPAGLQSMPSIKDSTRFLQNIKP